MQTQETKLTYGMKGKLISAVAMLLVAIIMVVSSTYAWFTLSTAPEVTGISTAVGANGALEMLLLTKENGAWVYNEGVVQGGDINTYWGNLVDLSGQNGMINYGLDKITLFPSSLNLPEGATALGSSYLLNPAYGPDGRVTNLVENSVTGTYSGSSFSPNEDMYGVRAVGTSSGMTDRQLAYRNAVSSASSNLAKARNEAANTLEVYGGAVGDIAVKKALNGDAAKFTTTDINNLKDLAGALQNNVIPVIEEAYKQYIIAFAASKAVSAPEGSTEEVAKVYEDFHSTVSEWFETVDAEGNKTNTIYNFSITLNGNTFTLPADSALATGITELQATKQNVTNALGGLNALAKDEYVWSDISTALTYLVDVDAVKVCGMSVDDIRKDMDGFVAVALEYMTDKGGIVVSMATEGGVYADVADHCGDYSAGIVLHDLKYGSLQLETVNARMATATLVNPAYLVAVNTLVTGSGAPEKSGNDDMPISEFYGYIVDLAFRTNAAESDLLLQQGAVDRIYSDNAEGSETFGGGSNMTFAATTNDFTNDQVKALMASINVVFFTTDDRTVLAYAKLDMANATTTADGITADLYLYEMVDAVKCTITEDGQQPVTKVLYKVVTPAATEGGTETITYYEDYEHTKVYNISANATVAEEATTAERVLTGNDAVITPLIQNTITHVSALVYLDGEKVTNKDVAATVAQSMSGKLNLQFASSANLVPMDYEGFKNPENNSQGDGE